jgi:hypothetical protein
MSNLIRNYSGIEIDRVLKLKQYRADIRFHLVGIRAKNGRPNKFDDQLIVISEGLIIGRYDCTTRPGKHWLQNLLNPKGTAVLVPGQYLNAFRIGQHQGKYEALVQQACVTVYRDSDRDEIAEATAVKDTGMFGINIHRANNSMKSLLVDKWSAGCQVIADPKDFSELMRLCKLTGKGSFTYTLLDEAQDLTPNL